MSTIKCLLCNKEIGKKKSDEYISIECKQRNMHDYTYVCRNIALCMDCFYKKTGRDNLRR